MPGRNWQKSVTSQVRLSLYERLLSLNYFEMQVRFKTWVSEIQFLVAEACQMSHFG